MGLHGVWKHVDEEATPMTAQARARCERLGAMPRIQLVLPFRSMKRSKKLLSERDVGDETPTAETRRENPEVNAVPGPDIVDSGHGESGRIRARCAWLNWDENEVAEELAPWPAARSR